MPDSKQPVNVWLIEDHKTYGERLMRALNRLDDVRCEKHFTACEDALATLGKSAAPRVLLLDVELPGMSGIEGLALLRQQAPATALVILTVFEDDDKIFRHLRGRCRVSFENKQHRGYRRGHSHRGRRRVAD